MSLALPLGYTFRQEIYGGCLGQTIIASKENTTDLFVIRRIPFLRVGGKSRVEDFMTSVKLSTNLLSKTIVPYTETLVTNDIIWLIRPFINGIDLNQYLQEEQPDANRIFVIWKVILRSYQRLHRHKIAPNFIRPNNIIIGPDKNPVITDLYPPLYDMNNGQRPTLLAFLAPEFFQDDATTDKPADIWSLGVLLLYMMTQSIPWNTKNLFNMIRSIMKGYAGLNISIPKEIEGIIHQTVIADPTKRADFATLLAANPTVATISTGHENKKLGSDANQNMYGILAQRSTLTPATLLPLPIKISESNKAPIRKQAEEVLTARKPKGDKRDPFQLDD